MNGTSFNSVTGTMKGIAQLNALNHYERVQAETMSNQAGINFSGLGNTVVTDIDKGDWISVSGTDFSSGCKSLTVRASSVNGSAIKICKGGTNGTAIGYAKIPAGGSFSEITVPVESISGTQDISFVFSDQAELDW